jgi:HK97 family phage major capsid protein
MNQQEFERRMFALIERKVANSSMRNADAHGYAHLILNRMEDERADKNAADFALRQHDALREVCGEAPHGGFWMRLAQPVQKRDLDATSGSDLIPTRINADMIPSLVPNSSVIASGAQIIPVDRTGPLALPRIATGATVSVTADNSAPAGGDPTFDQCILTPFTVSATISFSKHLARLSAFGPALESAIAGDLQRRAFAELDRIILAGSGSGEPQGIIKNSNVATYAAGTNGAAPTPEMLYAMEEELGSAYSGGALTWFVNAAMRKTVRNTATGAGLSPLWSDDNSLMGYSTVVTEHIPSDLSKGSGTNLSASVLGDFSQVVIGFWKPAFEVVFNPYATNGSVALTVFMDVGFGLMRNEAFIACSDFVTS